MRAPFFLLLSAFLILESCTIYSSSGRKEFEEKAPNYVKTTAFVGCEPLQQEEIDQGFFDSFLSRSFFKDDRFWVAKEKAMPHLIQVLDYSKDEVCSYLFQNQTEWLSIKDYFLKNLP